MYFLHIDFKEGALDIELDIRVSLLNLLEQKVEHSGEQSLVLLIVDVWTLERHKLKVQ